MEETIFDLDGTPVAYIAHYDEKTIYMWDGTPVAYLNNECIYGFNGKHLGWFENGIIWNLVGEKNGCIRELLSVYSKYEPFKSFKQFKPFKAFEEFSQYKPSFNQYSSSNITLSQFLLNGRE